MWHHQLISKVAHSPTSSQSDLRAFELQIIFQASRAPVAIARETEYSGRRTQEGYRSMCSDFLYPAGEVRGCSVGCTIGMWDIAPLVLIIAAGRYTGFLERKKCLLKRGCCLWVRRAAGFSGVLNGTKSLLLFFFRSTACNFESYVAHCTPRLSAERSRRNRF